MKTQRKVMNQKNPKTIITIPSVLTITTLDLSCNQICIMENLSKLKQLVVLNLSENKISKIQNIFGLENLESVYLKNNLIESLPKEMKEMKSLKILDVRNNRILFVHGIAVLEGKMMKEFMVEGNRVTKRPKFKQMMDKILEKREDEIIEDKDQILEMEYMTTEGTYESVPKANSTIPLTTSIQLIRTFRSMTQVQSNIVTEQADNYVDEQFENLLQIKDKDLSDKKTSIMNKYNQIIQYSNQVDKMIQNDRPYLQQQQQIVKIVGKFILDANYSIKTIVSLVKTEIDKTLEHFQSYCILETNSSLKKILQQNQLDHQSILKSLLNMTNIDSTELSSAIEKIKEYASFYNSLKSDTEYVDSLIYQYAVEFNKLYQIIQLKTVLEQKLEFSCQIPIEQAKDDKIKQLEAEIFTNNQMSQSLIRQNNVLLQKIDNLVLKIQQKQNQIEQLKERWIKLQEIREQGNMMMQNVIQKQDVILGIMEQKLTGDFFQNLILNQAKTIETLIATNKSIKDKIYIQQTFNHKNYNNKIIENDYNDYVLTRVETGKKIKHKNSNNHEYSAQSNLLSQRPKRYSAQLPIHPISYFSKSINLLKSKGISQSSTQRGDRQVYNMIETYRDNNRVKVNNNKSNHNDNTIGRKKIIFNRDDMQQSDSYKQYKKYYLRNSIIDVLIDKKVHPKMKQRYDSKELRLRKFKQISSKRILQSK